MRLMGFKCHRSGLESEILHNLRGRDTVNRCVQGCEEPAEPIQAK